MSLPRLVILDRDGVINFDSPDYILAPEQFIPIPGSLEAIAALARKGVRVAVASNQSAVGRGWISEEDLARIHERMLGLVRAAGGDIHDWAYCVHAPGDDCRCRKPKPGLVQELLARAGVPPREAVVIGDSARDIEAAAALGVPGVLVATGYKDAAEQLARARRAQPGVRMYPNLRAAVRALGVRD